MSRNGSGTYSLPAGNPVVTGTTISSTWANNTLSDIATALTQSIASDGQTTPTSNLPMGTFKHTGVAVGTALTDYARYDQLQNSSPQWLTSVSGVDTITASASVTPSAYAAGQTFRFVSAGANTGAVTLNISSLGAKAVTKKGTTALSSGDIPSGVVVVVTYDGTQFQLISLINVYDASTSSTGYFDLPVGTTAQRPGSPVGGEARVNTTTSQPEINIGGFWYRLTGVFESATTQKAIFGYGTTGSNVSVTNLVSNTGVVATDTTGVGTARYALAAAGYGGDKAIFGYGYTTSNVSMTNLVSNTGVVATDTTGVGTARYSLAAAGYSIS